MNSDSVRFLQTYFFIKAKIILNTLKQLLRQVYWRSFNRANTAKKKKLNFKFQELIVGAAHSKTSEIYFLEESMSGYHDVHCTVYTCSSTDMSNRCVAYACCRYCRHRFTPLRLQFSFQEITKQICIKISTIPHFEF